MDWSQGTHGPNSGRLSVHEHVIENAPGPLRHPRSFARSLARAGWTLIEMMLVVAIAGTIMGMALPFFRDVLDRARVARAVGDIDALQIEIAGYEAQHNSIPNSLADIGWGQLLDPWGNTYEYLSFEGAKNVNSIARKDQFLVPLNTTYDLYSVGADGQTRLPLTAKVSKDDVLRANDGGYIGIASKF